MFWFLYHQKKREKKKEREIITDVATFSDGSGMNFHDVQAALFVGQRDLNFSVQSARSQQSRIECVGPIRGHNYFHFAQRVKAVHLIEQLHECALYFTIGRRAFGEAATADGVYLVHENDARLVIASVCEHLANHARTLADVLVDDGARHDFEEAAVQLAGDGASQQSFAGAGRTVEQAAFGRRDADTQEQLGVEERQLDDLAQLSDLLLEAADLGVAHIARILVRHVVDERIDLARQIAHYG